MEAEDMRSFAIDAAMRACVPTDKLHQLMAIGLQETIETMIDNPVASTDVCTLQAAYTPGTANSYSRYHVTMWHDLVAVRVLQRFSVLSSPPPVFRNWIFLGDPTGARPRGVLMHRLMTVNRECMGGDTRVLYEGVLYYLCNMHLPGVSASIVQPDGPAPEMASAQASHYYALRIERKVSADGLPQDVRNKHCVQADKRICLHVMAGTVLDAFTNTWRHNRGASVLVAVDDTLRAMVVDESYAWYSTAPADHPAGPGTWRLLLPSRRARASSDIRVQTRGCQNTVFWPYPGQNTDIIQNIAQNIRP